MSKGMNSVAAGIAAAMAVGTVAYVVSGNKKRRSMKKIKRNAGKMMRVMENVAGSVSHMMK